MHPSYRTEFVKLFQEFTNTFANSPEGQEHILFYAHHRQSGRRNFEALTEIFSEQDLLHSENLTEDLASQVLQKLLPHANSVKNQERNVWIHHAPAITGDIQKWYEATGSTWDWPKIAHAIFHFVQSCINKPDSLQYICDSFVGLAYTKGFQAGMLTPILNALNPEKFLLINSKSQRVIRYFTNSKCSSNLSDYPTVNQKGYELIQQIKSGMREIWDSPLSDGDQFDMFCHWLVSIKKHNLSPTQYWKISPGKGACQWSECKENGFIGMRWNALGDISALSRKEFDTRRDDVIKQHPNWKWTKSSVNQVWVFAHIKEGDRIIANRGTSEVLGIGTVTGPYYYQPDVPENDLAHRIPVHWDDLTPRIVDQRNWKRTLIALDLKAFDKIPKANNKQEPIARPSSEPLFTKNTFQILQESQQAFEKN